MIPTDEGTLHRAVMAYLDLRKDNLIRQVWIERDHIYMLPEGMPPIRSAAEFIPHHEFISLVDSLSPGVIITEISRKPVLSETSNFGSMWLKRTK